MSFASPSSAVVTRAVDLLSAAGFKVFALQTPKRIDRDEYEVTITELCSRKERREGGTVIITGNHEDHGRVTLRREAGRFSIEADDLTCVRDAFMLMDAAD